MCVYVCVYVCLPTCYNLGGVCVYACMYVCGCGCVYVCDAVVCCDLHQMRRHRVGRPYNTPRNDVSYTENFVQMLDRLSETNYRAHPRLARALDVLFILHAEVCQLCVYVCMCVCVYVCMYVCMYVYVCMCVCVYLWMWMWMCMCVYVCVCV